ncbi:type III secretion system chaperone family protein [Yersinia aldovae]|uniref:Chaperone protein sigE n=1 Tax=Yersinia aldovae TaxID=29483 RepID=A0ABM9SYQ5_YERAL|nr:hypothetical protein [Yersinia aldovae]AJJ62037.1 chaperone protein sigE [Yersinia aldovae 670-83]CNK02779.1 Chaperone protein sigE [Yersinia aldovae]CNL44190.1 Chaperone protein sigE [Yersinia aldovae]
MHNIIYRLYDALGLEIDGDDPALVIDNDLTIYFNESEDALEMCCPVGPLPTQVTQLQNVLKLNYASSVVLATDAENTLLLALQRFPETSCGAELEAGLNQLITITRDLRQTLI